MVPKAKTLINPPERSSSLEKQNNHHFGVAIKDSPALKQKTTWRRRRKRRWMRRSSISKAYHYISTYLTKRRRLMAAPFLLPCTPGKCAGSASSSADKKVSVSLQHLIPRRTRIGEHKKSIFYPQKRKKGKLINKISLRFIAALRSSTL